MRKGRLVMNAKDIFTLVLRLIGVLGIIYVIRKLDPAIENGSLTLMYLILKLGYLAVGLYFIRGAPLLVRFAYPVLSDKPTGTA